MREPERANVFIDYRGPCVAGVVVGATGFGLLVPVSAMHAWGSGLVALSAALLWRNRRLRVVMLALAIAALGAARGAESRDRALAPELASWFAGATDVAGDRRAGPVDVAGRLARDAEPAADGARLVVDVHALRRGPSWVPATGRAHVFVGGSLIGSRLEEWTAGRAIEAPMTLRAPQVALNPGGPSVEWQTLTRGFDALGTVKSAALVSVRRGSWRDEAAAAMRAYVRQSIARGFPVPERRQSRAVVTAILIGDRTGLDEDIERRLRRAGTYHVIAISGGNIAILAALAFAIARTLVRSYRIALAASLALVASYGSIVAGEPSVARATLAACLYLGARLAGLTASGTHVLGLVALVLVLGDPRMAIDVGAWLSFLAALAIVLAAHRFLPTRHRETHGALRTGRFLWRAAFAVVAATAAAELALLPINAGVFTQVGIAGLVLNLIAIPAMTVVQIAGMAWLVLAPVSATLAGIAALGAHLGATALVESSRLVDVAPWLAWRVPPPAWPVVVTFYGAAAGALVARGRIWTVLTRGLLALSANIIAFGPGLWLAAPRVGWLRMTVIDVGQGDALFLQFPDRQSLLVDAGGTRGTFDVGDRIVTPALWALGARRLTWQAVTHTDGDHVGGAWAVLENFRPVEIWDGVPVARDPEWQRLREAARRSGAAWRTLQRGDRLEAGSAVIDVLNPPLPDWERQRTRNDDSLVLRVRFGDVELLLPGDVGSEVEQALAVAADRPRLRILKVAHHGSRTSSSSDFIGAYAPAIALISAGRGNPFGHPAPDVVRRFVHSGVHVFRTDADGAIRIDTDGRVVHIDTARGRTLRMRKWP